MLGTVLHDIIFNLFTIIFIPGTIPFKEKMFRKVSDIPVIQNACDLWNGVVPSRLDCSRVCSSDDRCVLFTYDENGTCSTYCVFGTEFEALHEYFAVTGLVDCGSPSVDNGDVTYESSILNSVASVECNDLFQLFGNSSSARCDSNGQWGGFGACRQVEWRNENTFFKADLPEPMRDGWEVIFNGTPKASAEEFSINFVDVVNVPLHVNIRFTVYNQVKIVVFNSMIDGVWGTEEEAPSFPFDELVPFEIRVKLLPGIFKIIVNGADLYDYTLRSPSEDVARISITTDVLINKLKIIP
ncbi:uncharacterized protein LOC121373449 [Gigantopelta aegis]|uniref:uncharacterized protein LOC121373449 n=1 Tax=Gigantopelta aegis TaxID=1735272 RepID=UPI001B88D024|nr:uncharacterized protein LOC121373449 [Gigantopelta aegis]